MNYFVAEKLISVENVYFNYGDKVILKDFGNEKFPFEIYNIKKSELDEKHPYLGQTVAVLGASGSGKSTFFKLLSGLNKPKSGKVLIPNVFNSEELTEVEEGDVGFVQQKYPLSRNQTVKSMLVQAARQGKLEYSKIESTVNNYLNDWGLENQKNLAPSQLSGGQRQRVAILEQLLCSHHFIIFDEPFSGLDVKNIADVKESFKQISELKDINTIIFSTHDIDLAVELADTIYIIGYEKEAGKSLPGGTIIGHYDLKKMGLAWEKFGLEHKRLSEEICDLIRK